MLPKCSTKKESAFLASLCTDSIKGKEKKVKHCAGGREHPPRLWKKGEKEERKKERMCRVPFFKPGGDFGKKKRNSPRAAMRVGQEKKKKRRETSNRKLAGWDIWCGC